MAQWPEQKPAGHPRLARLDWTLQGHRRPAAQTRLDASLERIADRLGAAAADPRDWEGGGVDDDRLRLIFTCCHPALPREGQVALTLREVCDLTREEIAHAFLVPPATLAQRIVRAKARIREEHIPYEVPSGDDLGNRLGVLQVVYLVFNEGYSASSGESLTRPDLSGEAIRLGRLLLELLPGSEVLGLLGLMLLTESRRAARTTPQGDLVLLEDQDRSLWNREQIAEGAALARLALSSVDAGPCAQAAIAATTPPLLSPRRTGASRRPVR
jgi:RNA polymerase sigma-70 factor (ECF subfamily)